MNAIPTVVDQLAKGVHNALEVWTLQNLCDLAILVWPWCCLASGVSSTIISVR
jgi:hypothetical protein